LKVVLQYKRKSNSLTELELKSNKPKKNVLKTNKYKD